MNGKKYLLTGLIFLIFSWLLLLQVWAVWPFTVDDMYISLRYARHWAAGDGLFWNLGEEPVEGYSSFSFVVLAKWAIHLGLDPVIVLKAAGFIGLCFAIGAIYCLTRFWFSPWFAFIPSIWLLLNRGQIAWSTSGLETAVYQALICFSLFFLLRGMGYCLYPKKREGPNLFFFALAGFLLAVAGLTRPETPAWMLLFYSLALFDRPWRRYVNQTLAVKKDYYQGILLSLLICLLFFLPYFFWRWVYFGQLLANSVYCKGFVCVETFMADKGYLYQAWAFFLLALPAIFGASDKRHYFFWLPSLLYLTLLIGADPVNTFENRLFLPVFILLLPLAFLGLSYLCNYFFPEKDEVYSISLLMGAALVAFFFIPSLSVTDYRTFALVSQQGTQIRHAVLDWLKTHVGPGEHVVLGDAGQIPYLSSLSFIDSYCLNNKAMTVAPRAAMFQRLCAAVFIKKPKVLILTSKTQDGSVIYHPTDACLHEKLKTNSIYQFRTSFQVSYQGKFYRYEIYTRKDRYWTLDKQRSNTSPRASN
jgi:hypothetical protein